MYVIARIGHPSGSGLTWTRPGHHTIMGIGTSIFLIAVGAVLRFAVTATVSGIALATVGTILIIVGVIGLVVSLVFLMQAGHRGTVATRERVTEREPYVDPYA